ncbi:MAG: Gfo/Idh/MocA family oxidoreductase [Planctomycetia bacterium]|nr:Gfo/Idh/MocA family oxidoreductase [Planctomycetia bacterium]
MNDPHDLQRPSTNPNHPEFARRDMLRLAGAAGVMSLAGLAQGEEAAKPSARPTPGKTYRIGVVSAAILGKPQKLNGHTWHFAQYLHPTFDFDALKRHNPPAFDSFQKVYRNPKLDFGRLPFPDSKITHYYDADPAVAKMFTDVFPGVQVATSLEKMAEEVDAIWMGDASGLGEDHFDLCAPGLAKGLPTFCDKPIGGTVAGTKKILDFARKHKAPIMSASIFCYEWGMENALRIRDSAEFGQLEHVSARLQSRYSLPGWMIYGQHPVWTVMTLMGAGVDSVSLYEYKDTCHGLITWPDRYPCHVWFGQPYVGFEYDRTDVYFKKKLLSYTSSIDGDFAYGHKYQMFRMAEEFLKMVRTGVEPIPHQEILEVTAVVWAGAKSLKEQSRLVKLSEVMG